MQKYTFSFFFIKSNPLDSQHLQGVPRILQKLTSELIRRAKSSESIFLRHPLIKSNFNILCKVLMIFLYNITECRYIGYTLVALLVEVNSIFLHLRKLMQMMQIPFDHPVYRTNVVLNLASFVCFRYLALVWITYGIIAYNDRMSTTYTSIIIGVMFVMWIINSVLFLRLLKNDIYRNTAAAKKPEKLSLEDDAECSSDNNNANNNNLRLSPKHS